MELNPSLQIFSCNHCLTPTRPTSEQGLQNNKHELCDMWTVMPAKTQKTTHAPTVYTTDKLHDRVKKGHSIHIIRET